jgi:hypothetical protein
MLVPSQRSGPAMSSSLERILVGTLAVRVESDGHRAVKKGRNVSY